MSGCCFGLCCKGQEHKREWKADKDKEKRDFSYVGMFVHWFSDNSLMVKNGVSYMIPVRRERTFKYTRELPWPSNMHMSSVLPLEFITLYVL